MLIDIPRDAWIDPARLQVKFRRLSAETAGKQLSRKSLPASAGEYTREVIYQMPLQHFFTM